jgi:hypothetical protein
LIPPVRPRVTAFVLGIVLTAIIGAAAAIPFLIPRSKHVLRLPYIPAFPRIHIAVPASTIVAAIGLIAGLVGFIFLVHGNVKRTRLIYEFSASAVALTAWMVEQNAPQEDAELARESRESDRWNVIEELSDYENALLRLGAYEQALQVSQWIAQIGGRPPHGPPRFPPRRSPPRRSPPSDFPRDDPGF